MTDLEPLDDGPSLPRHMATPPAHLEQKRDTAPFALPTIKPSPHLALGRVCTSRKSKQHGTAEK